MALSITIQPRDAGWMTLGTQQDGGLGIVAESLTMTGDLSEYGCLSATFKVKQNPKWISYHLEQFTPVVVKNGDTPVWSGRIIATPTTFGEDDVEVLVECQGWGQHLKDDCTDKEWVIDDLSRFQNTRSRLDVTLTTLQNDASVDGGAIMLPAPQGSTLVNARGCSATIDLGPGNVARRAVSVHKAVVQPGSTSFAVYLRISNSPEAISGTPAGEAFQANPPATASTLTATATSGGRYVHVFWYWAGASIAAGGDHSIQFTSVKIFTETAYESGNASNLKASTVIRETLDAVAPLISTDRTRITTTSTNLPNFPGSPAWRYGHELIDQANAIHGYTTRLTPDPTPVFEYSPIPTDYSYAVGANEYTLLEPAAQDGRGVFSRVISEFEDAAGVRSYSTAGDAWTNDERVPIAAGNHSFTVDTTGWSPVLAAISRNTGTFNSGPASLYVGSATEATITGLVVGKTYRVTYARRASTGTITLQCLVTNLTGPPLAWNGVVESGVTTAWGTKTFEFVAQDTTARVEYTASGNPFYIDDVYIQSKTATVVDRRGFRRTALRPMTTRTTTATADALANLELSNSQYPPFRGTIGITGRIRQKGGTLIDPVDLIHRVGDAILIEDLVDPNTGNLGRVGVIQKTSYDEKTQRIQLEIDRADKFIAQLRARLAMGA